MNVDLQNCNHGNSSGNYCLFCEIQWSLTRIFQHLNRLLEKIYESIYATIPKRDATN